MKKNSSPLQCSQQKTIALNREARYEFQFTPHDILEAGLVLQGWEVKSLRAGKAQITDSYVVIKKGECWLIGSNITPLISTSTHLHADPTRSRKLLLHRKELNSLIGLVERKGYTLIPLRLYSKEERGRIIKLEIVLAKGKKQYDKRETEKNRDWERQQQRLKRRLA